MKIGRFFFVMIACAGLVHGTSMASQSDQAPEQAATPRSDKSAAETPRNKEGQDASESGSIDRKTPIKGSKRTTKTHSPIHSAKPTQSHPVQSANTSKKESLRSSTSLSGTDFHQTESGPSSSNSGKAVKHSNMTVPKPNMALNGQQFKNSREPGPRLASSGGPANSMHGAAAINGSDIKRKP